MSKPDGNFKAFKDGENIAKIEQCLLSGECILPIVVGCLQRQYSINDYSLFFEGYNRQKVGENV